MTDDVRVAMIACVMIVGWFSSQTVYLMAEAATIVFQVVSSGAITAAG